MFKIFKPATTARQKAAKQASIDKLTNTVPAALVFGVAAYQSFWHTVHVALAYHQDIVSAFLMPFGTDGLFVVCARYVTAAQTRLGKAFAVVGVVLAMAATVAFNLAAAGPGVGSKLVSMWPAVGMITAALVMHYAKPHKAPRRARKANAKTATQSNVQKLRTAA